MSGFVAGSVTTITRIKGTMATQGTMVASKDTHNRDISRGISHRATPNKDTNSKATPNRAISKVIK